VATITNSITLNAIDGILSVQGTNSCGTGGKSADYAITIDAAPNSLQLTSGNKNEVLCVNSNLTRIQYTGNPGQTLVLNGLLPPGITFTPDPVTGSAIIAGTPTLFGNYLYSITTDNSCGYKLDGSIVVKANAFINYVSGSGRLDQVVCVNTPIEDLTYTIPPDVITTNVTITPSLPIGLSYFAEKGNLKISGTPTSTFTATDYSISVNNGCGTPANSTFKLAIVDSSVITLEAGSGALSQSVCQNGEILPIKFKLSGGATGIDLSLLPTFITSSFDTATGIYTLTGAPKTAGVFVFDIKTIGNSSCSKSLPVSISNLYAAVTIVRTSAPGSDNQILCSFKPIITIVYDVIGNVTISDIKVKSLPGGVTPAIISTTTGVLVTISGTPTVSGIFDYGIVYQNCSGAIMLGKISVSPPISVTGKVTPITCVGNDGKISVTILGGSPFITIPLYSITWTGPNEFMQNQTTITGLSSGDYKLKVVDAIGCTSPDITYTIAPSSPINVLLKSQTSMSCNGTLGCANFNITGGTGIYTSFLLQYDDSSPTGKTIIPANNNYFNICGLEAGDYKLTATDSKGCSNEPLKFDIKDDRLLSIKSFTLDTQLCANTPGKIRVEVNNSNSNPTFFYNSVLVSSNALGNNTYDLLIINPKTSGILTVKSQSCSVSEFVTTATLMPNFGFTSDEFKRYNYFSVNSSIEFTNFDTSKIPDGNRVVWSFGDNTPSKVFYSNDKDSNSDGESFKTVFHTYTKSGIFEVTLTLFNSSGCSKSITKSITIESGNTIMIPTAFSPNDDGRNDFFSPYLIGFKEVSIYIYDNWSNLVYEGNLDVQLGPKEDWGWNGIEKGNTEPKNGTYRYYIMAKTIDNKIIQKIGEFLLIK
jgi:gliding motility-associated-like protein